MAIMTKIKGIAATCGEVRRLNIGLGGGNYRGRVMLSVLNDDDGEDVFLRPSPHEARQIAAALIEAADKLDPPAPVEGLRVRIKEGSVIHRVRKVEDTRCYIVAEDNRSAAWVEFASLEIVGD